MPTDIHSEYFPTPKQLMYHQSRADELLYGGAAGGGKSRAAVEDAFDDGMQHPGVHTYMFRKTYPELRDTLIKEAKLTIPKACGRYLGTDHDFILSSGSVIHFRYCRNMNDAINYQGAEMHRLYMDELTHFEKKVYDYLKTRVRAAKKLGVKPYVKCGTNPGGIGHAWVKGYFIDIGAPFTYHKREIYSETLQRSQTRTIQYIPAFVTDNPHLTEDYIFELEQKPEALRKALLNGDWSVFEGQVFIEFRDDPAGYHTRKWTHVIAPFKIPDEWRRIRSLDWGYSKPFSIGYWAVDPDGRMYRYAELYGTPKDKATGLTKEPNVGLFWNPRQLAKFIREHEDKYEKGHFIHGVADPSIWDSSRGEDGSIINMMEKEGLYFDKADNERIPGKMQMHYRLAFDEQGYPMMYVMRHCRDWLRTVPAVPYDKIHVEDIDTDSEDHAYDETRYACMEDPIAARTTKIILPKPFNPLEAAAPSTSGYTFLRM